MHIFRHNVPFTALGGSIQRLVSNKLVSKAGIHVAEDKPIGMHSFRHTMASILISHDVPLINVSNFLGHSDISTTANIYAHLDKASKQASADIITGIFDNKSEG